MFLIPGDSPIAFRLPLKPALGRPDEVEFEPRPRPFRPARGPLPPRQASTASA
jgi:uncharacterized protein (DUF2126 family)